MASFFHSSRPHSLRFPRSAKKLFAGIAAVFAAAVIVVLLLPGSFWRGVIVRRVSHATGREARIDGEVTVRWFSLHPALTVEGFSLANAKWAGSTPSLAFRRLDVAVDLLPLFHGELNFARVILDAPNIDFERNSAGQVNWDFGGASGRKASQGHSAAPMHIPAIRQLRLTQGRLKIIDEIRRLHFNGGVSVNERQKPGANGGLSIRGTGTLNDKPFDLQVKGAPLLAVDGSRPYAFDAGVTAADIKLDAHVAVAHPFDLASVRARFELSAKNLADVYYLTGLALPNTAPYRVSGTLERDRSIFKINDFRGTIGASDIAGTLAVDTGHARPKLTARLMSKELKLSDLAAPLGAGPAALPESGRTLTPAKSAEKGADAGAAPSAGLLLPDADLQVNRVRGMDADVPLRRGVRRGRQIAAEEGAFPADSGQWQARSHAAGLHLARRPVLGHRGHRRARSDSPN